MLKDIRKTLRSVGASIVVVLLIIAFAAWGVPEIQQLTRNSAIRVGGEGYSALEVQQEFDRYATNRRLSGENNFDRAAAIEAGVPDQIVQSIATRSALDQESLKMGLLVSRDMVRDYLHSSEQFRNPRTGKFDNEVLEGIMRDYNYSARQFEDRLQSDLLRSQLMSAIGAGGAAPKSLVDALVLRETERRTISYITITDEMSGEPAPETPEALKEYYEKNSAQFMAPEYRTFSVVVLKNSDFAELEAASEAELRKTYEENKSRYESPERRTIYQITYPDEDKAAEAAAALNAGQPFEALAAAKGQSLADVTLADALKRDILDPKVAEAVFEASEAGAVVGPVKGTFGFAVAQIAAISPASVKSFEEVRSEIEAESRGRESKRKLFEAIESIENLRDTGAPLSDAAAKAGATAAEYGPVDSFSFGKGGEIIAGIPGDVLREAFRLDEGEESDAVEFADKSGYFFVSVTEVAPPAVMPFERVAEEVAARWRAADQERRLSAAVKSLRDAIDSGASLRSAAESLNRAPIVETVTRRSASAVLSEQLLEQVFAASKGETVSGPTAIGDAQVVITVDEIGYDLAQVSPGDVSVFSQYVGGRLNQELVDAYAAAVLHDARVKISQPQIDALFADAR